MSARLSKVTTQRDRFCTLGIADVPSLLSIEQSVYAHPWSERNFIDSFDSAYLAFALREKNEVNDAQLFIAYIIAMQVVDEFHLLNLAVRIDRQGQGCAQRMLDQLADFAREQNCLSLLLEVRVSNAHAIKVYSRYGFVEIGRRKGYYPAVNQLREDALVMRFIL